MVTIREIIDVAKRLKGLYVEDNPEARESTVGLLSNIFRDVVVAIDGEDGLKKFYQKRHRDDRQNTWHKEGIAILVLSAYGEAKYIAEAEKLGIDGYLLKPIESKPFMDTIAKTVEKIVTT